jgi:hypothetical protein
MKKLFSWVTKNEGLVLVILLVIVLRIPSLYEPYWYGDEGIYLVLGQGLRKGLVFYRDIHDNKPPLLYFLAAIAGNVFYFRLLLMIWFSLTVSFFFKFMQMLFPKNERAWYVSSLVMIALTTMSEGNIANAEIFIVLPVVMGMMIAYAEMKSVKGQSKSISRQKVLKWLGVGLLFSVGFLLKVPAAFDMVAVVIWLLFFHNDNLKKIIKGISDLRMWLLGLGFLIPVGISLAYYTKMGAGERYLRSALMQNIGYLVSWSTGEHSTSGFSSQSGLLIRAGLLLLTLIGFWWFSKKLKWSSGPKLIVIWTLLGLFGALLSERPYPHYLIQVVVPGAILVSYFIYSKEKLMKLVVLGVLFIIGFYYYQVKFWYYPIIPYYNNFISYALGKKSVTDYQNYFDWRVSQNYKLAEYLRVKTQPEDRIFIWGDEPGVYALANRLPIGRYTVAYHVADFNGFEETLKAFDEHKPKVVIKMEYENRAFQDLDDRLSTDYTLVTKIDQALVYHRINPRLLETTKLE